MAAAVPDKTKTMTDWGKCPSCRRTKPLSGRGVLREHRRWVPALRGEWSDTGGSMQRCDGSGKSPLEDTSTEDSKPAGRHIHTVNPGDVL
ncbi:MAG TPA: hypothetical protein VGM12_15465 [Trebonia sp.]